MTMQYGSCSSESHCGWICKTESKTTPIVYTTLSVLTKLTDRELYMLILSGY